MAAEQAGQALLVYYVGHGLVSYDGALYLATQSTDRRPTHLKHTALAYGTVRDYLPESPARSLLVVLDCCFSGRAAASLVDPADEVISVAEISGACVRTSAGHDELAMAPLGARHTSFSGELLRLLTAGDPYGPPSLTIHSLYRSPSRSLPAQGLPRPRCRFTGRAGELVLARNTGHRRAHQDRRSSGRAGVRHQRRLPALGPDLSPKGKAPLELAGANLLQSSDRAWQR